MFVGERTSMQRMHRYPTVEGRPVAAGHCHPVEAAAALPEAEAGQSPVVEVRIRPDGQ